MSKSVTLLLVLFLLMASCITVAKLALSSAGVDEDFWVSKASMQAARSGLGVAAVNGKIYAIGGVTSSGFVPSSPASAVYAGKTPAVVVGSSEEYDPATDTWTFRAAMPTPRAVFAIAVYQNKIYCIGGKTSSGYTGVNEVYDPATNTWETKTAIPTARAFLQANVVNGKIYLIGGDGLNEAYSFLKLNEVYDPATDTWITKEPMPSATFFGYASAVFDNKIYIIGSVSGSFLKIYDPETDIWSSGTSPPLGGVATGATTGILAPKRIYVLDSKNVGVYDPANDSWSLGADAPTSRYNFGVAVANDTLYVIGGHTYSFPGDYAPIAVNEQYTPIGYGTPDPTYQFPSPSPAPTQTEFIYAIAAGAAAITIIAITAVALKKQHQKNTS
jgi:N-acetylneuraminic acid mutarotase